VKTYSRISSNSVLSDRVYKDFQSKYSHSHTAVRTRELKSPLQNVRTIKDRLSLLKVLEDILTRVCLHVDVEALVTSLVECISCFRYQAALNIGFKIGIGTP
jgi:DNA polymerase III sliding clamp (beta) subunit (PCNA family)